MELNMPLKSLIKSWREGGVNPGDVLLVHSSAKRTLVAHNVSPQVLVQSFLDAVGPNGTMLFPLWNFDFTKGVTFDIRNTPSHMGIVTETARLHPNAIRSGHPIYNVAAIGKHAAEFGMDNASGYGLDSPFGKLRELNGKIGVLDLDDQNSQTFYHHIEEMHDVQYRYQKEFTGQYLDMGGNNSERTYSLFVRDIEKGILTDVNRMGEVLWKDGLYSGDRMKEKTGFRVISANSMYDRVSEIITGGKAIDYLYSIRNDNEE